MTGDSYAAPELSLLVPAATSPTLPTILALAGMLGRSGEDVLGLPW